MIKKSFFLPLMAAAIAGPFLFFAGEGETGSDTDSGEEIINDLELTGLDSSTKKIYEPAGELGEIINFNLTPAELQNRFPDATQSSVNGYSIYRTSMLIGHGPEDPVGALTYQFGSGGRLKQIQFTGFVTSPSKLVNFVTGRFGFARTDESGLEFQPTTFSGHSGNLKLTRSRQYRDQLQVELVVSR